MKFQNFRSVGRCAYLFSEIIEECERSQDVAIIQATAIQALKSSHQFAIDGGSWRAAFALSLFVDPYGKEVFGGSEEELSTVVGYLKAQDDLQERVKITSRGPAQEQKSGLGSVEEEGQEQETPAGKGSTRPRARGRGR